MKIKDCFNFFKQIFYKKKFHIAKGKNYFSSEYGNIRGRYKDIEWTFDLR